MASILPYYSVFLMLLSTCDIIQVNALINDPCDYATFMKASVDDRQMVVNYKIWKESNAEERQFKFIPIRSSNLEYLSLRGGYPKTFKNAHIQSSNYNQTVFSPLDCAFDNSSNLIQDIAVNRPLFVDFGFGEHLNQTDLILDVQMGNDSNYFHRSYPILSEANAPNYIQCSALTNLTTLNATEVDEQGYPFEIYAIKTEDVLNIHFIQIIGPIRSFYVHVVDSDSNIIGSIRYAINDAANLCSNELYYEYGDITDIVYEIIEWKPNATFKGHIFIDTYASISESNREKMTHYSLGYYEFVEVATTDKVDELSSTETYISTTLDDVTQATENSSLTSEVTSEAPQVTIASQQPETTYGMNFTTSDEDSSMMTSTYTIDEDSSMMPPTTSNKDISMMTSTTFEEDSSMMTSAMSNEYSSMLTSATSDEGSSMLTSATSDEGSSMMTSATSDEDSTMTTSPENTAAPDTTVQPVTVASGSIIVRHAWGHFFAALILLYLPLGLIIM